MSRRVVSCRVGVCVFKVVVPHVTASYADGPKDQVDDAIPMCTLRNFPSLTEHCIEWARWVGSPVKCFFSLLV